MLSRIIQRAAPSRRASSRGHRAVAVIDSPADSFDVAGGWRPWFRHPLPSSCQSISRANFRRPLLNRLSLLAAVRDRSSSAGMIKLAPIRASGPYIAIPPCSSAIRAEYRCRANIATSRNSRFALVVLSDGHRIALLIRTRCSTGCSSSFTILANMRSESSTRIRRPIYWQI